MKSRTKSTAEGIVRAARSFVSARKSLRDADEKLVQFTDAEGKKHAQEEWHKAAEGLVEATKKLEETVENPLEEDLLLEAARALVAAENEERAAHRAIAQAILSGNGWWCPN